MTVDRSDLAQGPTESSAALARTANDTADQPRAWVAWVLLAVMAIAILAARLHTYNEPQECDIAAYAAIAHAMLHGQSLYSDLWDHKPPAIHAVYALAELLTGYGPASIYLLNVVIAIVTLLGVFYAAKAGPGNLRSALWAAAFWTVISGNIYTQANQPNTEVFINACMIWAFALLLRPDQGAKLGKYWLVGALFAVASLFKQIAVFGALGLACAHLASGPRGVRERLRTLLQLAIMAGVGAAAWIAVAAYFTLTGRADDFYEAVFLFNRSYAGPMFGNLADLFRWRALFPNFMLFALPLAAATLFGLAWGFGRAARAWSFLLLFGFSALVQTFMPGHRFAHYYQYLLPMLAVGAAWGIAVVGERLSKRRGGATVAGLTVLVALAAFILPSYRISADGWSKYKHGGGFVMIAEFGRLLDRMLLPDETFFAIDDMYSAGLYYYSGRAPAHRFVYCKPLLLGPRQQEYSDRLIADLEHNPPEIIVVAKYFPADRPVIRWARERYVTIADNGMYRLTVRKNGRLAGRL